MKKRDSNIELLRIIIICGVIILHFNSGVNNALQLVNIGSLNYYALYFLESMFICAVDVFVIITGYFMSKSTRFDYRKPLLLIIQVIIFNLLGYFIFDLYIYNFAFSIRDLLLKLVPTNYFAILYSVLYILSPYLNSVYRNLKENEKSRFIVILLLLFSLWPTALEFIERFLSTNFIGFNPISINGSQGGYSIVNFILLYFLGCYLRDGVFEKNKYFNLLSFLLSTVLIFVWCITFQILQKPTNVFDYCNPLIIFSSVNLFLFFKKLELGEIKIINSISKSTFTVFLFHQRLLALFNVSLFVNEPIYVLLLKLFEIIILTYFICYCLNHIYAYLEKLISKCLDGITNTFLKQKIS